LRVAMLLDGEARASDMRMVAMKSRRRKTGFSHRIHAAYDGKDLGDGTSVVIIAHDDDCPFLVGIGPCRCIPDIERSRPDGLIETVDELGRIHTESTQ
jgi:hypothetical protein